MAIHKILFPPNTPPEEVARKMNQLKADALKSKTSNPAPAPDPALEEQPPSNPQPVP